MTGSSRRRPLDLENALGVSRQRGVSLMRREAQQNGEPLEGAFAIEVTRIRPNPAQPRKDFDSERLRELAESIATEGLISPIVVQRISDPEGDYYQIIAGERRWRAVTQYLHLETLPAIIKDVTSQQAHRIALQENIQRVDLNPTETHYAIRLLMEEEGLNQTEVARTLHVSPSKVSRYLGLGRHEEVWEAADTLGVKAASARAAALNRATGERRGRKPQARGELPTPPGPPPGPAAAAMTRIDDSATRGTAEPATAPSLLVRGQALTITDLRTRAEDLLAVFQSPETYAPWLDAQPGYESWQLESALDELEAVLSGRPRPSAG